MGFKKFVKKSIGFISKPLSIASDATFGTNFYGSSQDWQHQKTASNLAFQQQQDLINQQNIYNSPLQQMQRLRDAGLNPNLVYGQVSPGSQTSIADVPRVYKQYSNRNLGGIGKALSSVYWQAQNLNLQNQKLQNDSLKLDNDTKRLYFENERLNIMRDYLDIASDRWDVSKYDWRNLDNFIIGKMFRGLSVNKGSGLLSSQGGSGNILGDLFIPLGLLAAEKATRKAKGLLPRVKTFFSSFFANKK